ncbi:hypothetical protein ACFZBE_41335 [Streptomyces sp. NPDC008061]|uniref:hypothetical protein n=1 Tax=Streptomyces sp. NPDC008061 TaxID=3364805 RepID=UPI0036E93637
MRVWDKICFDLPPGMDSFQARMAYVHTAVQILQEAARNPPGGWEAEAVLEALLGIPAHRLIAVAQAAGGVEEFLAAHRTVPAAGWRAFEEEVNRELGILGRPGQADEAEIQQHWKSLPPNIDQNVQSQAAYVAGLIAGQAPTVTGTVRTADSAAAAGVGPGQVPDDRRPMTAPDADLAAQPQAGPVREGVVVGEAGFVGLVGGRGREGSGVAGVRAPAVPVGSPMDRDGLVRVAREVREGLERAGAGGGERTSLQLCVRFAEAFRDQVYPVAAQGRGAGGVTGLRLPYTVHDLDLTGDGTAQRLAPGARWVPVGTWERVNHTLMDRPALGVGSMALVMTRSPYGEVLLPDGRPGLGREGHVWIAYHPQHLQNPQNLQDLQDQGGGPVWLDLDLTATDPVDRKSRITLTPRPTPPPLHARALFISPTGRIIPDAPHDHFQESASTPHALADTPTNPHYGSVQSPADITAQDKKAALWGAIEPIINPADDKLINPSIGHRKQEIEHIAGHIARVKQVIHDVIREFPDEHHSTWAGHAAYRITRDNRIYGWNHPAPRQARMRGVYDSLAAMSGYDQANGAFDGSYVTEKIAEIAGVKLQLADVVNYQRDAGAKSLTELIAFVVMESGATDISRRIRATQGSMPGFQWVREPEVEGLPDKRCVDVSQTGFYRNGHLRILQAPWTGRRATLVIETSISGNLVDVRMCSGLIHVSAEIFGHILKRALASQAFSTESAVVLAIPYAGAGGLEIPRTVAAITGRTVYAASGDVRRVTIPASGSADKRDVFSLVQENLPVRWTVSPPAHTDAVAVWTASVDHDGLKQELLRQRLENMDPSAPAYAGLQQALKTHDRTPPQPGPLKTGPLEVDAAPPHTTADSEPAQTEHPQTHTSTPPADHTQAMRDASPQRPRSSKAQAHTPEQAPPQTKRTGEESMPIPVRWDEDSRHFVLDPHDIARTVNSTEKKQIAATADLLRTTAQQKTNKSEVHVKLEPSTAIQTLTDIPDTVTFLSQVAAHRTPQPTPPLTIILALPNGYTINLCPPTP